MTTDTAAISTDTIAARATAPGAAAVAIVRISGPLALTAAERIAGPGIGPREALLRPFRDPAGDLIDRGLVLYFPAPRSFTGEDVVELQCHGGPTVVDWLLEALHTHGVRAAEPGEFSLRAFLNDKLDLTQAEAIADLIGSGSRAAARAALRSLDGEFAGRVAVIQTQLTAARVLCEAWLDFPDEELDPAAIETIATRVQQIGTALDQLAAAATSGVHLTDGITIAIAGSPNAGKSSLLNRLLRTDAAIVSDQPGTTRDAIAGQVVIAGQPVELIDTAGLRESGDELEQQGIARAHAAVRRADLVLWVADVRDGAAFALAAARAAVPEPTPFALLLNKIDLAPAATEAVLPSPAERAGCLSAIPGQSQATDSSHAADAPREAVGILGISALHGTNIAALMELIATVGGQPAMSGGSFSARRRHLAALAETRAHLAAAAAEVTSALDIAAEELRAAQTALSELTGEVTSDDLLGRIFATFCIGK